MNRRSTNQEDEDEYHIRVLRRIAFACRDAGRAMAGPGQSPVLAADVPTVGGLTISACFARATLPNAPVEAVS